MAVIQGGTVDPVGPEVIGLFGTLAGHSVPKNPTVRAPF
jgi:hypothetical protein